ncbi:hypothetical protein VVT58_11765 [Sphingobium sp. SJ10-10]|uniref:hypothetical protein n=1 Tax=Sphingobium sp. SJ10-10 TaxID=3114999 RepID=UPI002E17EABD|nr:hypothetical protein [Sphingobium sp. SJ10-10]
MASIALDRTASPSLFSGDIPRAVLITAFLLFLANIFASGLFTPLWLDENFSATIAAQPNLRGLIDWCLNELSGPLYYSVLWTWEKVAGDSNAALRIPALFFSMAAPAFLLWKGHEDRTIRYLWALSIALWQPGFSIATEARPYSLMLFLGCVQAVCFLRLMQAPTTARAGLWAGVSALAVLTHYHAAVIAGIQGIAYLMIWQRVALRTWPAAFILVPMAAWMSWHLHVVLDFAGSGYSWYQLLSWKEALFAPLFLCGSVATLIALGFMLPVWAYARFGKARSTEPVSPRFSPEMVLICTGLLSAACVVAMGFVRPSYSMRYLLPYVGAVSLLIPIVLRDVKQLVPAAPMAIILLLIGSSLPPLIKRITDPLDDHRYGFNFEQPSEWIMQNSDAHRLVYLWDNPTALMGKPDKLADVGGFFFRRSGRPVEVLIPRYALNADPYPTVLALTKGRSDTAIIWAYDRGVPNTSALLHPPRLSQDKRWTCRNFGLGSVTVLACIPHQPVQISMAATLTQR